MLALFTSLVFLWAILVLLAIVMGWAMSHAFRLMIPHPPVAPRDPTLELGSITGWFGVAAFTARRTLNHLVRWKILTPQQYLDFLSEYASCSEAAELFSMDDVELLALRDVAQMIVVTSMDFSDVYWLHSKGIHSLEDLKHVVATDLQDDTINSAKLNEVSQWVLRAHQ